MRIVIPLDDLDPFSISSDRRRGGGYEGAALSLDLRDVGAGIAALERLADELRKYEGPEAHGEEKK